MLQPRQQRFSPPHVVFTALLLGTALGSSGCAQKFMVTSDPIVQKAENDVFLAQLSPDKEGGHSFIVFKLTVINKTSDPMAIDWNQSRYFYNGRLGGVFLFEGMQPGYVKNATTMVDVVPGNSAFHKVIAPADLVAYAPIKYQNQLSPDEKAISAGPMPPGQNGIHLVVHFREIKLSETITVDIQQIEIK